MDLVRVSFLQALFCAVILGSHATTTTRTTFLTSTSQCSDINNGKVENCYSFLCQQGRWTRFEFTATYDCCNRHRSNPHPRCVMIFPELYEVSTTGIFTTANPTEECKHDDTKIEDCFVYTCYGGRWSRFEFTATLPCCNKARHPKCRLFFPDIYSRVGLTREATLNI